MIDLFFQMKNIRNPRLLAMIGLFFGILCASTAALFIKSAQNYASSLVIAAYRLSLAALILAPFTCVKRKGELKNIQGHHLFLTILSGLFLAIHFAVWITSLQYTSVASSVVFVSTTPLWTALLSPLFLRERVKKMAVIGMIIAFLGGIAIGISDTCALSNGGISCLNLVDFHQGKALLGDLLAIIGAIMAALYLIIGRKVRSDFSLLTYIFLVYGFAGIILITMAIVNGDNFFGFPPIAYVYFLLLAIFPQLLGHTSINLGVRYLSVNFVSIALLAEPIGSTILAFLFLGEIPEPVTIFGGLLILGGIIVATLAERVQ